MIKRAIAYVVLSSIVLAIYALAIGTLEFVFENMTGGARRITTGALILALLLAFNPSRQRIQAIVDRLYDRRRYEYRDAVRIASRDFASILDVTALTRIANELIDETLQPTLVELFTIDEGGRARRRGRISHEEPPIRVIDDRRLAAGIDNVLEALGDQEVAAVEFGGTEDEEHAALALHAGSLAAAMRLEGRLVGLLIVGPKRSGGYHTGDDVELLRTISGQLAVALENAEAYHTIDVLNRDLESQNVQLERANADLHEAQDQLIRAERLAAIGELAGAVAHAIRNPLAAIKMAAEFGEFEYEGQEPEGNFHDITSEASRLEQRITHLLDFARPFEPITERVTFNELVGRAVEVSQGRAAQKDVRLRLDAGENMPEAELDEALFEQVVIELVANAIDAAPDSGNVRVATGSENGGPRRLAWLTVTDDGPGIPEEKIPKIFDLFFTTKKTGTGFGLATVRKVVERHGGRVTAANGTEGGASFRVEVPTL